MATGYLYHELFGWHDTGTFAGEISADPKKGLQPYSNFEHSDTKRRIHELIVVSGLINHLVRIEPRHATEKELLRVHTQRHIDFMRRTDTGPDIDRLLKSHIEGELMQGQSQMQAQQPQEQQQPGLPQGQPVQQGVPQTASTNPVNAVA